MQSIAKGKIINHHSIGSKGQSKRRMLAEPGKHSTVGCIKSFILGQYTAAVVITIPVVYCHLGLKGTSLLNMKESFLFAIANRH